MRSAAELIEVHCPKCGADFCPDCISRREREVYGTKKQFFFCPKCNIPAETLSAGSFVVPFWTRLPKFFVYPLHPKPLLLIALLSFAAMLLSWLPFVNLILWGILIKYCYAVLTNTARGNLRPPDLSYDVIWQDFGQAFKQIGLFLIVGIAMGVSLILIKVRSPMLFSVGMYLPLETTFAIFVGGIIRGIVDKMRDKRGLNEAQKARVENAGVLTASGLIAGEALMGLLIAGVVASRADSSFPQVPGFTGVAPSLAIVVLVILAAYMIFVPLRKAGAADEPAPPTAIM